ncbi:hypothetical protein QTL95_21245 [Rhizobium sp. S152]|uniref:COG3904 family protein n=1 Tax=Rhizobium sp. S152 TaxID=3055038 RepID=UPI0025A9FA37|nr:hypothetical protein [Rhizobium sp. S152]MDM9628427.1 hypothetical protein [Rhizobium sp. S152]
MNTDLVAWMGRSASLLPRLFVFTIFATLASLATARADITLRTIPVDGAPPVLIMKGEFTQNDDPNLLTREIGLNGAKTITFDSNGGNVAKAMEYGRLIRSLGLSTLQLRSAQCASACALAFVGGAIREAEPGSIGVHQSSFSSDATIDGPSAVAAVQAVTAQIMTYLIEMDVDPKLLQLSLSVPSDDMRYLTSSEMQSYRVTHSALSSGGNVAVSSAPSSAQSSPPTGTSETPPQRAESTETKPLTSEQKALVFIAGYHDAWSRGNGEALGFMEKAYADTIQFYGKPTPKAQVMTEKRDFAERWPIRAYSVRNGSVRAECSDKCRIDGVLDWYAKKELNQKISSGAASFSLVWDQSSGLIVSEQGKVIEADKDAFRPNRLIVQWIAENTACRGGQGTSSETQSACERREVISAKLQVVGWCYGREGEYGYQMQWHPCGAGRRSESATVASSQSSTSTPRPNGAEYRVEDRFNGKTVLPDFKKRDREFNSFRTRIRDGMREGPNFAGHYSLIQIGCGAGCSFVIVGDNKTGRPSNFPRGGEDNMYLALDFKRDSRLVAAQWFDYDTDRCFLEYFDFAGGMWKVLSKFDIGPMDTCYKSISENLR